MRVHVLMTETFGLETAQNQVSLDWACARIAHALLHVFEDESVDMRMTLTPVQEKQTPQLVHHLFDSRLGRRRAVGHSERASEKSTVQAKFAKQQNET